VHVKGFLATSVAYMLSATLLRLVGVGVTIWLATQVTDAEYGRFGLAWALQQFVTIATLGGIVEAVIGRISRITDPDARLQVFSQAQLLFLLIAGSVALMALCCVALGLDLRASGLETLTVVAYGVALSYSTLLGGLARLEEHHAVSILFATLPPLAGLAGGLAGFKLTGTMLGFFVGSTASCLLPLTVSRQLTLFARTSSKVTATLPGARGLLGVSAPFAITGLFGWLSGIGTNVLIERFFPLAEVGHYTLTLTLASALQVIAAAMNSVWSPRFYQLANRISAGELEDANRSFYDIISGLLGAAGGALLILVPAIGPLLGRHTALGEAAGFRLALMVVGYLPLAMWWQCSNHLLAAGAGRVVLSVTVFTGVAGTLAWVGLMLVLGPQGIYLGFPLMTALRSFFLRRATLKYAIVRWPWKGNLAGTSLVLLGWAISDTGQSLLLEVGAYGVVGLAVLGLAGRRDVMSYFSRWRPSR
jgi:O-antigen/teichoic acid export membrane protein